MAWTEQRKATATELWLAGKSASEIARAIGDTTRNAVIGMIHRAKLAARMTPTRPSHTLRQRPPRVRKLTPQRYHPPMAAPPRPAELDAIAALSPLDPTLSVLKLGAYTCRFPIGDPKEPGFAFCGRTCDADEPYCVQHRKLTYVPTNPRRAQGTVRLVNWLDRGRFDAAGRSA